MSARKLLYTVTASFIAGAIVGILYAPDEGAETRKKISRMKRKISFSTDGLDKYDRETLQQMSVALQAQLDKINEKIEKA